MPASEPDTTWLARQLLEAIKHARATLAAPKQPVEVVPAPPTEVRPASPFGIEGTMFALDSATTSEEAMAAVMAFVVGAQAAVKAAADPVAALTTVFGSECVATGIDVFAAAVHDLEAVEVATSKPVTERAASRIARNMVDRVTLRASRTMARAPRAHLVPRVRILRAPRAGRAPRRAVRLSAVASAGSGGDEPSPEPPGALDRAGFPAARPRCVGQSRDASAGGRRAFPLVSLDDFIKRFEASQ
jgi:hypothetical protein